MDTWALMKDTASGWSEHKDARLGAALAYYSVFSIGPLILICISIAGLVFGAEAVRNDVSAQVRGMLGDSGARAIDAMLAGASQPTHGLLATLFGIATLIAAAIGVVAQLKDALNAVWEVEPSRQSGIWAFIRTYLISLAGVLSLGFLLLTSLVLTAALAAGTKYIQPWLPEAAMQAAGVAISFGFVTLLFAMMFKWLPDADVAWRDVWVGGVLAAALFEIGKFLIGFYIGKQGLESTYGAAASLVVLLIWVYYSSQIVLIGAEFTRAYAKRHGSLRSRPAPTADTLAVVAPAAAAAPPALQFAARQTSIIAALLAVCTGWLVTYLQHKASSDSGRGHRAE
jgi:membrane protein